MGVAVQSPAQGTCSAPERVAERLVWLDCARGIGIILVVAGHVIRGLRVESVGPELHRYQFVADLIYSFHMPLFFFVSGFLFGARLPVQAGSFLRSTGLGVVYPYVLWSVVFVLLQNAFPSDVNNLTLISNLFGIATVPISHMWFLHALFVVQVAFFVAWTVGGTVGLLGIGALFAFINLPVGGALIPFYANAAMGGTFFAAGLIAQSVKFRPASKAASAAVFLVAGAFWLSTALALLDFSALGLQALVAASAGIVMTIAACQLLSARQWPSLLLAQLGQASIAIYVMHTVFDAGLRSVFYHFGIFDCDLHVVAQTTVGVVVPTMLFIAANRAEVSSYVGFGRQQKFLYADLIRKRA